MNYKEYSEAIVIEYGLNLEEFKLGCNKNNLEILKGKIPTTDFKIVAWIFNVYVLENNPNITHEQLDEMMISVEGVTFLINNNELIMSDYDCYDYSFKDGIKMLSTFGEKRVIINKYF